MVIRSADRRVATTRRTTIALPVDLLDAIDNEVNEGRAASRNELIAEALAAEVRRRERERIDAAFGAVLDDPDYQREVQQVMDEFESADREAWAALDPWPADA